MSQFIQIGEKGIQISHIQDVLSHEDGTITLSFPCYSNERSERLILKGEEAMAFVAWWESKADVYVIYGNDTLAEGLPIPELVTVPAGDFLMGGDEVRGDEKPQHLVFVREFEIGKYPVTNFEYRAFVLDTGHKPPPHWLPQYPEELDDHPVVYVSWHDAVAYCKWLSQKTGKSYCLPSEAEWEKAARGTDGREFPWGNEWDASKCNSAEGGPGCTTPVGKYSPAGDSPYGAADMAGNVWEWCSSLYRGYPYDPGDGREDWVAEGVRVLRGGAFYYNRRYVRCACRLRSDPFYRDWDLGFRVVVSPSFGLDRD